MVKTLTIAALCFCQIGSAIGQGGNENYKFSDDITSTFNRDTSKWKYQLAATAYSISGYYQLALQTRDRQSAAKSARNEPDETYLSHFETVSAKDYIIHRSQREQIIIINEAHHNAAHRTFTKSLLQGYIIFQLSNLRAGIPSPHIHNKFLFRKRLYDYLGGQVFR